MIKIQDKPTGCVTSQTTTSAETTTTITKTTSTTTPTTTTSTSTTTSSTITKTNMGPNRNAVLVLNTHNINNKPFIVDFNGKYVMFSSDS